MKITERMAKFFGKIKVRESNNLVKVTGIDGLIMRKTIAKVWDTDIVGKMMFSSISDTSLSIHSFFLPDFVYILSKLHEDPKCSWSSKQTLAKIIHGIYTDTWLKCSVGDVKPMVDPNRMKLLKWKPMPKQLEFLHMYGDKMPRYDLRGYILAFAPGGGKAQPYHSQILTTNGWVSMGNVTHATLVKTPDGGTARVIGIYPQGKKDIYRVTLEDGRFTECCLDHLWKVYYDTSDTSKIVSLKEMMVTLNTNESIYIPISDPSVEYTDRLKIKHIAHIGEYKAQCIMIDHPDHLYITDDYIVTHNTFTDLLVATCVIPPSIAEVKIIVSPKKAMHLVWEKSIRSVFKKRPKYWCSDSGDPFPNTPVEYYIFNYEQLEKALDLGIHLKTRNIRFFIIVDESHNFADYKSNRTKALVKLQTLRDDIYFLWTSGSPILKTASELVSFLKCADPRFDSDAEAKFKRIYTSSPGRANEIFNHRLGKMMAFIVPKSEFSKSKPIVKELPVKLPPSLATKFLMDTVKEEMRVFIKDRLDFYSKRMESLRDTVNTWLDYHKSTLTSTAETKEFNTYIKNLKIISKNPDVILKDIQNEAREYEKQKLLPSLPPTARKEFRSALSAIKNIKLKVRGEALGTILAQRRSECAAALAYYCKPEDIIHDSLSKTIFFASSILPIKVLSKTLLDKGFSPLEVYGGTNAKLTQIMEDFDTNPQVNPLCATMQSLSEAVPVTSASTVVLLNRPFRQATYDQVISRADRLGQIHQVTVYEITLDTGDTPNVSSTTDDILENIRDLINQIVGKDFAGPDPDEREYKDTIDASRENFIDLDKDLYI